jgi:protease-4
MINDMYERFLAVVKNGRPNLTEDRIRQLADGRVYTATQALDAGLIDGITTMRGAMTELKSKTGQSSVKVVAYQRPLDYRPNYYAESPASTGDINLLKLDSRSLADFSTPKFMYLWAP